MLLFIDSSHNAATNCQIAANYATAHSYRQSKAKGLVQQYNVRAQCSTINLQVSTKHCYCISIYYTIKSSCYYPSRGFQSSQLNWVVWVEDISPLLKEVSYHSSGEWGEASETADSFENTPGQLRFCTNKILKVLVKLKIHRIIVVPILFFSYSIQERFLGSK